PRRRFAAPLEKLVYAFNRVVGLTLIVRGILSSRRRDVSNPIRVCRARRAEPRGTQRHVFDQIERYLVQKARSLARRFFAEDSALHRMSYVEVLLGSGDGYVAKTAFFFEVVFAVDRSRVREQPLFQTGDEHDRKLQSLGRVNRHQGDPGVAAVLIGVGSK